MIKPNKTTYMKPSKSINRSLLALAACALTPLAAQASLSLITNGSFETLSPADPGAGLNTNSGDPGNPATVITGWTQSNPSCTWFAQSRISYAGPNDTWATAGSNFVGVSNVASLSQMFNSPSAGSATLAFDFMNINAQLGDPYDLVWSLNGTVIGDSSLISGSGEEWVHVNVPVTLRANNNTLTFASNDPSADIEFLDNVTLNLTAVPEPGSLLALGCLIGSGAFLRSRRR